MRQKLLEDFIRRVWSEGDVDAADDYLAAHYCISHDPGDPWDGKVLDLASFKDRVRQSRAPFPDPPFFLRYSFYPPSFFHFGFSDGCGSADFAAQTGEDFPAVNSTGSDRPRSVSDDRSASG